MPGFESDQPEPSGEEIKREADLQLDGTLNATEQISPESDVDNAASEPPVEWEKISSQMERFSNLSSDMIALISELSQEAKKAMDELRAIQAEVSLKKSELKTLHDMEESAAKLQRLIKDRRLQIADMERHLERQRSDFETEKSRREQEDEKYLEDLKAQRQSEEAEYLAKWAAEQLRAKEALENEFRALRQESTEKQEALNKDLNERERQIMQKEKELDLLTQELEQFMSRMAGRTQAKAPAQDDSSYSNAPMSRDT